jgi:glycolate oxidase
VSRRKASPFEPLRRLFSPADFSTDPKILNQYASDKWFASSLPEAVALPRDAHAVSSILRFASAHQIPVTPRGAGFGYVGGCVPVRGGIVLSLERMKRIKEISVRDFVAVVEPGVTTADLQKKVEALGLFYPPDPASRADCSIGGNIATNAGGPRCLKYGVTRDYVLGLNVVLADGTQTKLGSRTHKNKTGFDLTRLFVGSEGMLGIVTEATLKLLPLPPFRACIAAGFSSTHEATHSIADIFEAGFLPAALEIADAFTLRAARERTKSERLEGCESLFFVEIDGQEYSVRDEIKRLETIIRKTPTRFVDTAFGQADVEELWSLRREFSFALRDTGLTKLNEDVVVPRGRLEDLFKFAARLQKKHGLPVACFGHAGDGNIHVNVMVDRSDKNAEKRADAALDDLFQQILKWDGVITGEHGIGLAKKPWWNSALSPEAIQLHQTIKRALDPRNLLNPGKFLPDVKPPSQRRKSKRQTPL